MHNAPTETGTTPAPKEFKRANNASLNHLSHAYHTDRERRGHTPASADYKKSLLNDIATLQNALITK